MNLIEKFHSSVIYRRRLKVLAEHLAKLLPQNASVLDIGSGDGWLAHLIQQRRRDLKIHGLDVLIREKTYIPIVPFDGKKIPIENKSADVVMFVDVLHHTDNPMLLLHEAVRVTRHAVVIEDHTCDGLFAVHTLRFMDEVGNKRYRVALPCNYWSAEKWREAFQQVGLIVTNWESKLGLYAFPLNCIFERSLHFIANMALVTQNE